MSIEYGRKARARWIVAMLKIATAPHVKLLDNGSGDALRVYLESEAIKTERDL